MKLFFVAIFLVTRIPKGLCAEPQLEYPEFLESSQILRESESADFLDKENPQGKDAKMVFSCRGSKPKKDTSLRYKEIDDDLYAVCYQLPDRQYPSRHQYDSREWNHVLIFKCGTYRTDVFYSPSCDMKKVLDTFGASNTLLKNKCFATDIFFVDENGDLQWRLYFYELVETDRWHKSKVIKKQTMETKGLGEDFKLGTGGSRSFKNTHCRIPLKEVDEKEPDRIDWLKDAEIKIQCNRFVDSNEGVVARCYPLPKNYKHEEKNHDNEHYKETHVLIFKCGSYEMDMFYVSSCDMEIILNSFAVSRYISRDLCESRTLAFYGTNGDLQLREYKFSNGKTTKDSKTPNDNFQFGSDMSGFLHLDECFDKLGNRFTWKLDED